MTLLETLKPADVLLYKPRGVFGWIIATKTWHQVAHCEAYIGAGFSVASRDGLGVGLYPLRVEDLAYVCRPVVPFDMSRALAWFEKQKGTPYGWADLGQFIGLNIDALGIVCSPFVTRFLRAGRIDPFNGEPAEKIAPFEFLLADCFKIYEVTHGILSRRIGEVVDRAS